MVCVFLPRFRQILADAESQVAELRRKLDAAEIEISQVTRCLTDSHTIIMLTATITRSLILALHACPFCTN
eukprot:4512650-Pleurochrysis_carterae.AAC.1